VVQCAVIFDAKRARQVGLLPDLHVHGVTRHDARRADVGARRRCEEDRAQRKPCKQGRTQAQGPSINVDT